ncbi:MAG: hypothetical protein AAGG47_00095 [Pseudomonadota bacterium]
MTSSAMLDLTQFRVDFEAGAPTDAPYLEGHFEGMPIVPGAVLLGLAAEALGQRGLAIAKISRMKFQQPLKPDTPFSIEITGNLEGARISWHATETLIARAQAVLRREERVDA